MYIVSERRVALTNGDVTFDLLESHRRHNSKSGSAPIKIMYFIMSEICRFVHMFLLRRISVSYYTFMIYAMST